MSTSICSECHMSAGAHKLSCSHAQRLTNTCDCPNGSYGKKHTAECYEATITQLEELRAERHALRNNLTAVVLERDRLRAFIRSIDGWPVAKWMADAATAALQGAPDEPGQQQKYTGTRDQLGCTLCRESVWSHICPVQPSSKSEVRHCTNYLTYPGGQSCCTREAGHSGSCLF